MANEQQIVNKYKKGHYTRLGVLQSLISTWKGKKKKKRKEKKRLLQHGVFVFGHPS